MNVKKVFPILVALAGLAMLVAGAYGTWRGLDAKSDVRAQLVAQNITTSDDASIPNALVDSAPEAQSMAEIIAVHAGESTDGRTYSELGRFLAADGGDTSDEAAAALDDNGNPIPNPLRNVAFQASALQTSLYTSVMAFGVADLVTGVGIGFIVLGLIFIGFGVVLYTLVDPVAAERAHVRPVAEPVTV